MDRTRGRTEHRAVVGSLALFIVLSLCLTGPQAVRASGPGPGSEVAELTPATFSIRIPGLHRTFHLQRPDVLFFLYIVRWLFRLALYGALIVIGVLLLRSSRGRSIPPAPPADREEPRGRSVEDEIARLEGQIADLGEELERLRAQREEHTDGL